MLMAVALIGAGFAAGVILTALIALHAYGLLREEAVRIVDSYGMMLGPQMIGHRSVSRGGD
ncbi:MAG: hypothetical protein B7Y88_13235 [Sphingomonadales bacterium 32-64-17]|nr:MAG: hypothetical protein B7Y88_13235 [Sphingomonadales bacterium 32-64-17]